MAVFLPKFSVSLVVFTLLSLCACDVPVVTRVGVENAGTTRYYSLRYRSTSKPDVLWRVSSFFDVQNTANTFVASEGETTVAVNLSYYSSPHLTVECHLHTEDSLTKMNFQKSMFLSRLTRSNRLRPIRLVPSRTGTIEFEKGELVNIALTLESEDLGQFEMGHTWGTLTSGDYKSVPISPTYRRSSPFREEHFPRSNAIIMPEVNISGVSTTESTNVQIDTSYDYIEGELTLGAWFHVEDVYNLLTKISLRRLLYLKQRGNEAPFREFVNFYRSDDSNKRVDSLSSTWPFFQFDAFGYPNPQIRLYKECAELPEQEVERIVIQKPFKTKVIFVFKNVTDVSGGPYYISATNGQEIVTKQNYVDAP